MSSSIWSPGGNNTPAVDPLSQIKSQLFTATEGQTLFVITQFTYAFNSGAITVFVNGAKVPNAEVIESSTTSFTLAAREAGDIVEVVGNTAISDPGNAVALAEASAATATAQAAAALVSRNEALAAEDAAVDAAAIAVAQVPLNWRSDWTTATAYVINDAFSYSGSSYVVRVDHISTTVAADLATNKLGVIAESGVILSQAALDLKAPLDSPTFTGTVGGVTKAMVGLGNVDNTSDADKPVSTAVQTALNLKAPSASPSFTGEVSASGDIVLTGSGKRITGDFSNAAAANRVMLQSSTVNGTTALGLIPNGAGAWSAVQMFNSNDPNNSAFAQIACLGSEVAVSANKDGTGTYLPLTFYTGGAERLRIDTSGNVLQTSAAGLGYGVGSGGTVTQATSKSTAVTLNKPCGRITMNNAALAAGASVEFSVNNSVFGVYDTVVLVGKAWSARYRVESSNSATGSFSVRVTNVLGTSYSDPLDIDFTIIKGASS